MTFRLALSGLNAAQADLTVTANNIANTATAGFKGSRAEFSELFSVSPTGISKTASGNGVRVSNVSQQFAQGNIDFTENSLDLAVSGQGFFIVDDGGGLAYTRAGAFQVDRDGFIVNAQNQRLQAYPPTGNGNFNSGTLTSIQLITSESAPAATTRADIVLNLPASATAPPNAPFDAADVSTFNRATSLTTYDVKTAAPNAWTTQLHVDGTAVGTAQPLQYSNVGTLVTPANGDITFPAYTPTTGAAPLNLTFDFDQTTQYGATFNVNSITQDGFTTGRLIGIDIDSTGVVQARFTNGRATPLGQVALANFANIQGLQQLGDTNFAETFSSGQALRGQAGNSGLGLVQSGALEASNVGITEQLVNMITAQRNFQANAQMISTSDAVTQTIINIR